MVAICILNSVGITHVYWLKINHRFHEDLKPTQRSRFTEPTLLVVKYIHFGHSTIIFLWESTDTPRIVLVDHVAVAVAVGVGFDVILWYFIWLCWFDCARSSILPDVSQYPSKVFCFIGLLVYPPEFQWLFDGINAPFECRPRSCGGRNPCGVSMHGIWKSDVRGVSGGEEFSPNADPTLEWNIKCSNLSHGFWSVTKKKKRELFSFKQQQTCKNQLHIFQKGFCQAYTSLRKSQAFTHAKEVNG